MNNNTTEINNIKYKLPKKIVFLKLNLELNTITKSDKQYYLGVYSDRELMKFINTSQDTDSLSENFTLLIDEIEKNNPKYISFIINHESGPIGIVGIKVLNISDIEIGVIIQQKFQQQDWSRKIKLTLIEFLFERFSIERIVTYCHAENGAVNHINKSIGFSLKKQFTHKTKRHLMNKWVLHSPNNNQRKIHEAR